MMKQNVIGIMATCAMVTMLSSCSDHDASGLLPEHDAACTPMTFTAQQEPFGEETRISYLEDAGEMEQIFVVAQTGSASTAECSFTDFFYRNDAGIYSTSNPDAAWPNDSRTEVTFFAINLGPDWNFLFNATGKGASPLTDNSVKGIERYDNYFYRDVVAAYTVTSASKTNGGQVPLTFKHILAEIGINARGEYDPSYPTALFRLTQIMLTPIHPLAVYHFDTNTWSNDPDGDDLPEISDIYYFASDGIDLNNSGDYQEVMEPGSASGDYFGFLIPGEYTMTVDYWYDADGENGPVYDMVSDSKSCTVTLEQGKKNRINLTLPALDPVLKTW